MSIFPDNHADFFPDEKYSVSATKRIGTVILALSDGLNMSKLIV
jgi:hypothetical protein